MPTKPLLKKTALALLLTFTFSLPAIAIDSGEAKVTEIINLSAKAPYDKMIGILAESLQRGFLQGLAQTLQQNPVAPEHQEQAQRIIQKHGQDIADRFREHLDKTVPWDALVKDVYVPLYLKHFTPAEADALLAFYRSDAGKKFAEKAPLLMQEATHAVNEKYGTALGSFAPALLQEKMMQTIAEMGPLQGTVIPPQSSVPQQPESNQSAPNPQE